MNVPVYEKVVYELIKWIDSNIQGGLKIDDVAIKSGYSKWYLQKIFHQVTGNTLGYYISEKNYISHFQNYFSLTNRYIRLRSIMGSILSSLSPVLLKKGLVCRQLS